MISTWQCEMMKIRAIERAINNFMKILIINWIDNKSWFNSIKQFILLDVHLSTIDLGINTIFILLSIYDSKEGEDMYIWA